MRNRKNIHIVEILNDLINVNADLITIYKQAIQKTGTLDIELRSLFNEIISETEKNKQQLLRMVALLDSSSIENETITGKIYKAWADLKVSFATINRTSFMSTCQYNQDITKHAYLAALNSNINIHPDLRQVLEEQMDKLSNTNSLIKKSREVRHFANASLMYFN